MGNNYFLRSQAETLLTRLNEAVEAKEKADFLSRDEHTPEETWEDVGLAKRIQLKAALEKLSIFDDETPIFRKFIRRWTPLLAEPAIK